MFTIVIKDRNYNRWTIEGDPLLVETFPKEFHPAKHKLFHGDKFSFCPDMHITHSAIQCAGIIPGVLLLKKTYGSYGKNNKKMFYKCIPNDTSFPAFLIAYEMSVKGFYKNEPNQYILFQFKEWTDKHPVGVIDRIIGSVNIVENLYDYEIFCKGLENTGMKHFTKEVKNRLYKQNDKFNDTNILCNDINILCKNVDDPDYIFTIDPEKCNDYDDAFSVKTLEDGSICISVYISNVPKCLDKLNVWKYISQVATIYLPHKKKTMLPVILSDDKCSLKEGTYRDVFVMNILIPVHPIIEISFENRLVKISRNFVYDEKSLLKNPKYQLLDRTVKKQLLQPYPYLTEVNNSHDLVAYFMIFMNHQVASRLQRGVFRITEYKDHRLSFFNLSGSYIILENNLKSHCRHEALQLDHYIHITSPIRRIVDILNLILFQQQLSIHTYSFYANQFVEKWSQNIITINQDTARIRQVQQKCSFIHQMNDGQIVEGTVIHKEGILYHLYFLSISSIFITTFQIELFVNQQYTFCVHIFEDQHSMKQKIRLSIV